MATQEPSSWFSFSYDQVLLALSPTHALYNWFSKPKGDENSNDSHAVPEAPSIVSDAFGVSLVSQIRAFIWNNEMMQKAYDEHKNGIFRMPFTGYWVTVATGQYINEIARAPDTVLSFQETMNEQLELEHLAGPAVSHDMIHLNAIRMLTRNLRLVYFEILEETKYAFAKTFETEKVDKDGWVKFKATDTFFKIVAHLNHRAFVGLPLCRDEEWNKIQENAAADMMTRAVLLKAFPKSKRGNANFYLSQYGSILTKGAKMLSAVIEERQNMEADDRPNDMLTWIMAMVDHSNESSLKAVMAAFHLIDMAAQNTTVATFVHALYHLAAAPQYIDELREEVLEVLSTGEWTKDAIDRLRKLDSFVRETQRLSGISNISMARTAIQDFTFSNGVRVAKGEMVQAVGNPLHHDPEIYPDPMEFKPFRFYEMAEEEKARNASHKYDMITPSPEFLAWGLGKHACPGRWYASMIVKHLLAYILVYYEFKFAESTVAAAIKANANAKSPGSGPDVPNPRPKDFSLAGACLPNTSAEVLFRKRREEESMGSVFVYRRHE
ncbi:cytochrome P450 [Serendipita vermifera]|nr:cytochrome P450 [Serendipita vermifera]